MKGLGLEPFGGGCGWEHQSRFLFIIYFKENSKLNTIQQSMVNLVSNIWNVSINFGS